MYVQGHKIQKCAIPVAITLFIKHTIIPLHYAILFIKKICETIITLTIYPLLYEQAEQPIASSSRFLCI